MKKIVFCILIPLLVMISCNKENRNRWTALDINLTSLVGDKIPDSVAFIVQGIRSDFGIPGFSKGTVEIDTDILDGKYEGGFIAKTGGRWNYDLVFNRSFLDSFYVFPQSPIYISLEKKEVNTFNYEIAKYHPVFVKSFFTACNHWNNDYILYKIAYNNIEPNADLSEDSDEWIRSTTFKGGIFRGCDTNSRTIYCPSGNYEIAIKTAIDDSITGYYNYKFQVFEDSVNTLEMYY